MPLWFSMWVPFILVSTVLLLSFTKARPQEAFSVVLAAMEKDPFWRFRVGCVQPEKFHPCFHRLEGFTATVSPDI